MNENADTPLKDADSDFFDRVIRHQLKAYLDLEGDVAFIDAEDYIPNYDPPQSEKEFSTYIQKIGSRYESQK